MFPEGRWERHPGVPALCGGPSGHWDWFLVCCHCSVLFFKVYFCHEQRTGSVRDAPGQGLYKPRPSPPASRDRRRPRRTPRMLQASPGADPDPLWLHCGAASWACSAFSLRKSRWPVLRPQENSQTRRVKACSVRERGPDAVTRALKGGPGASVGFCGQGVRG